MQCSYTHPPFRAALAALPLKTMLEIGSLHGLDAIEVLKTYHLERVITIECNPECIEICKSNFAPYPNITLVEVAAWHEDSTIPFYRVTDSQDWNGKPTHNIGASSCFQTNDSWPFEKYTQEQIDVPARRLDGVLASMQAPGIDLICMDAQGAELYALQGLGSKLADVQAIITELEIKPMYHGQTLFEDVDRFLQERGFRLAGQNRWSETAGDFLYLRETKSSVPRADETHRNRPVPMPPVTRATTLLNAEELERACGLALRQFVAGRGAAAQTILSAVLEQQSDFFPAHVLLGHFAEQRGDFAAAVANYEAASAANPGHALPFTRRAILKLRQWLGSPATPLPLDPKKPFVTMSNLGVNGRFGNQLLQYGLLRLYAERLGVQVATPDWIGRNLFALNHALNPNTKSLVTVSEAAMLDVISGRATEGVTNADTTGYFCGDTTQWAVGKKQFQTWFEPIPEVRVLADAALLKLKKRGSTIVALHVRRGDFTGGTFWPAPTEWYLTWLKKIWSKLPAPVLFLATDDSAVAGEFTGFPLVVANDLNAPLAGAEFFIDHWVLRHADVLAASNSTFSVTAALLNKQGVQCWRPDRGVAGLRPFDPWMEKVLLD